VHGLVAPLPIGGPERSGFGGATPFERGDLGGRRQGVPFVEGYYEGDPRRDVPEEMRDTPGRRDRRVIAGHQIAAALAAMLGTVVRDATELHEIGGARLVARDRRDKILRWSFWSPTRRVLIDRFKRGWPAGGSDGPEMNDRAEFARANGIKYAALGPGEAMRVKDVRNWLGLIEAERRATDG
jgi:hypothetical protein